MDFGVRVIARSNPKCSGYSRVCSMLADAQIPSQC